MRTLLAWALLCAVVGCADRSTRPSSSGALAPIPAGPDPLVLRVSRDGGLVSALRYPALDSLVWKSSYRVPPLASVLGFQPDDGYLSAVDTSGRPVRLDLRLGAVAVPGSSGGSQHASADGAVMYALNVDGDVARYTPVGDKWSMTPTVAPAAIIPLEDESLVLAEVQDNSLLLRRVRPPDTTVVDSMRIDIPVAEGSVHGFTVGDRMFLSVGAHVLALRTRDFVRDVDVELDAPIRAMVSSPSGDRVYALIGDSRKVQVVDRFEGQVAATIALPAEPRDLRMDPLGRVLLARGDDSTAWVIDVGTSALVGAVRTSWRGDLPLVLPDGAVALARGDTVVFASSIDLGDVRTLPEGGKDLWYVMRWNGFRPRAAGLDQPVRFRASTSEASSAAMAGILAEDSARQAAASAGQTTSAIGSADSAPRTDADADQTDRGRAEPLGFTVQFAAVLSEETARATAAGISVGGRVPRIATSVRGSATLYRVVMGPYATRDDAEAAGKASGQTYWVFEGAP